MLYSLSWASVTLGVLPVCWGNILLTSVSTEWGLLWWPTRCSYCPRGLFCIIYTLYRFTTAERYWLARHYNAFSVLNLPLTSIRCFQSFREIQMPIKLFSPRILYIVEVGIQYIVRSVFRNIVLTSYENTYCGRWIHKSVSIYSPWHDEWNTLPPQFLLLRLACVETPRSYFYSSAFSDRHIVAARVRRVHLCLRFPLSLLRQCNALYPELLFIPLFLHRNNDNIMNLLIYILLCIKRIQLQLG